MLFLHPAGACCQLTKLVVSCYLFAFSFAPWKCSHDTSQQTFQRWITICWSHLVWKMVPKWSNNVRNLVFLCEYLFNIWTFLLDFWQEKDFCSRIVFYHFFFFNQMNERMNKTSSNERREIWPVMIYWTIIVRGNSTDICLPTLQFSTPCHDQFCLQPVWTMFVELLLV